MMPSISQRLVRLILGAVCQFEVANLVAKLRAVRDRKEAATMLGAAVDAQPGPFIACHLAHLHDHRQMFLGSGA
jgi:hypothetical protein